MHISIVYRHVQQHHTYYTNHYAHDEHDARDSVLRWSLLLLFVISNITSIITNTYYSVLLLLLMILLLILVSLILITHILLLLSLSLSLLLLLSLPHGASGGSACWPRAAGGRRPSRGASPRTPDLFSPSSPSIVSGVHKYSNYYTIYIYIYTHTHIYIYICVYIYIYILISKLCYYICMCLCYFMLLFSITQNC